MSESAESVEAVETPAESTETVAEEIPQWVREKLEKANNEAAKYRVKAKEAAEQARAELASEFEAKLAEVSDAKAAAVAELEKVRLEHMRLKAALAVGIPGESAAEFADLLKGSTEEEITAHAEKVKSLFGLTEKTERAIDPTQGLEGGTGEMSPGQLFASFVRNSK